MAKRDYYETLGIAKGADADEIKKAYRRKAKELHPDRNADNPASEGLFKEANEAYEVLKNNDKKAAYDRYGHAEGDAALRRLGEHVNSLCQRAGDFAFRVGGEEFGVITSSGNEEDGVAFAELIRTTVKGLKIPNIGSPVGDVLTVSLGVSMVKSNQGLSPDEIYRIADKRLYEAKQSGRNKTVS